MVAIYISYSILSIFLDFLGGSKEYFPTHNLLILNHFQASPSLKMGGWAIPSQGPMKERFWGNDHLSRGPNLAHRIQTPVDVL
jgi:hypothetical protein